MTNVIKLLFLSCLALTTTIAQSANTQNFNTVGDWNNVVDFSINRAGNHIIMTLAPNENSTVICEAFRNDDGSWTYAENIDPVNKAGATVGGVYLVDNESRFYFHANYPGGAGGFDIYYCDKTKDGWSDPVMLELSSEADETYPSLTPGDETIYFLCHQPSTDPHVEKKDFDHLIIYSAKKTPELKWSHAEPVSNAVNIGYVQDVNVSADGQSVYYSLRSDKKKPSRPTYTRRNADNTWLLPIDVFPDNSDNTDLYSVQAKENSLYALRANNSKQIRTGQIVVFELGKKDVKPKNVIEETGNILTPNELPVQANVTVYNPTTLSVLGRYESNNWDGSYGLVNAADKNYIVDVRNPNYSFASFMLDYKTDPVRVIPTTITLFDTVEVVISVFDSEIFRPLEAKVIAVKTEDKSIFRSQKIEDGKFLFLLPLGSNYNIIATSPGFAENKFLFKLEGDIIFQHFERSMLLDPLKRDIEFLIVDAQSKEPVNADVLLKNLNRDEQCSATADKLQDGKTTLSLRDGDLYDLTVSGAQGYAFHNRQLDLKEYTENSVTIELIALRKDATIQLNNINFATASSDIMPESYPELDRVVELLKENPQLKIEISAHTDNVGNASYNNKLSDRRAQSVVTYLVENGANEDNLVSHGYGMTKPLVPNDSEENRAINRRVEFIILDIEE